ncbi:uncharacterized protein LOC129599671 isoform X2 [Paramacrobiotus metropolitanus]|nr:uncharacterized protein LOC129599671 isoform X2 [Paramacrobiotus metropolitanus]
MAAQCSLSLRTLITTAMVQQRKAGAAPFSPTAPMSAAARLATREHVKWPDVEPRVDLPSQLGLLAETQKAASWQRFQRTRTRKVLGDVLTAEARQALVASRNCEECFAAWTTVMNSMLRNDENGSYVFYNFYDGVSCGVPKLSLPCIFVIKVNYDGTCPTRLMLWGTHEESERERVYCSVSDMCRMEQVATFKRKEMAGVGELAFLFFRGPRFFWGLQREGEAPQRLSGDCDARNNSGEVALSELREYLVKLPGSRRLWEWNPVWD